MKKRAKSKTVVHELKADQPLTARQKREIQALIAMPEEKIDTSDIPELPPGAWKKAVRGKGYRPVKQAVFFKTFSPTRIAPETVRRGGRRW